MSIKNIIDGSYDVNAPIDVEELDISLLIYGGTMWSPVRLTFSKVGKICTLIINYFSISSTSPIMTITVDNESILPFMPVESFTKDFLFMFDGNQVWGTMKFDTSLKQIQLIYPTNPIFAPITPLNAEGINYITN